MAGSTLVQNGVSRLQACKLSSAWVFIIPSGILGVVMVELRSLLDVGTPSGISDMGVVQSTSLSAEGSTKLLQIGVSCILSTELSRESRPIKLRNFEALFGSIGVQQPELDISFVLSIGTESPYSTSSLRRFLVLGADSFIIVAGAMRSLTISEGLTEVSGCVFTAASAIAESAKVSILAWSRVEIGGFVTNDAEEVSLYPCSLRNFRGSTLMVAGFEKS